METKNQFIILAFAIFIGLLAGAFSSNAAGAVLSLDPAQGSWKVGDTFQVKINLDTKANQTDGVDIYHLSYPAILLEVQDADNSLAGIQIKPGKLYPSTLSNKVSLSGDVGEIDFSQVTSGGQHYSGAGTLATITFKAKATGTANLIFDFTSGSTIDCNVVALGSDVLTSAIGSEIVLSEGLATKNSEDENLASSSGSNTGAQNEENLAPGVITEPVVNEELLAGEESKTGETTRVEETTNLFSNPFVLYILIGIAIVLILLIILVAMRSKKNGGIA